MPQLEALWTGATKMGTPDELARSAFHMAPTKPMGPSRDAFTPFIRIPAMNRRNALFVGHDEGGHNSAHFASLFRTCKTNGIEPYAYLRDLFTSLAIGHMAKNIDTLMPWACA